jgi:hypothetical protein
LRVVITGQTHHDNHTTRPTPSVGIRGNENIFVRGGLTYSQTVYQYYVRWRAGMLEGAEKIDNFDLTRDKTSPPIRAWQTTGMTHVAENEK